MSKICDLTGKSALVGNPNLKTKKFWVPELGEWITLKVSTSAIRTINKNGISACINKVIKKGRI
jgi:large subunit ribosomal protein L28